MYLCNLNRSVYLILFLSLFYDVIFDCILSKKLRLLYNALLICHLISLSYRIFTNRFSQIITSKPSSLENIKKFYPLANVFLLNSPITMITFQCYFPNYDANIFDSYRLATEKSFAFAIIFANVYYIIVTS